MTQRYFAEGKCGLSIRNSSNYHVLMRNADARTNLNVANSMQLKPEITKAIDENKTKLYPYIFIDRTNQAGLPACKSNDLPVPALQKFKGHKKINSKQSNFLNRKR